jgi:hypothetical protein
MSVSTILAADIVALARVTPYGDFPDLDAVHDSSDFVAHTHLTDERVVDRAAWASDYVQTIDGKDVHFYGYVDLDGMVEGIPDAPPTRYLLGRCVD